MKFRRDGSKGGTWASLASARAVAAFLLLVGAGFGIDAHAGTARVCIMVGAEPGITDIDCTDFTSVPAAELSPTDLVFVQLLEEWCWVCAWPAGEIEAAWNYRNEDTFDWEPWSTSGYAGGGGDPDPDPDADDEWSLEDLDLSVAAGAWAAAFSLVVTFWGLGKGIGLLVGFVRRM